MKRLLYGVGGVLTAAMLLVCGSPARAALQSNSLNNTVSPALVCSGPWIDVRCYGALGNDSHDDTAAITAAIADALANGLPLRLSPGTYKITSALTVNTTGFGAAGFRLIVDNATIDATAVSGGPALLIERTGGTVGSPAVDTGLTLSGALTVDCDVAAYCVQIGQTNFADEFKGARIDGLVVDNLSTSASAGGLKVDYLVGGNLTVSGYSAGGGASVAGLAIEQLQDSTLGGAGSVAGASGAALLIENGLTSGNEIHGFNYASAGSGAVSNTCVSITTPAAYGNAFIAPDGNCVVGVNAPDQPAGPQNLFIGANFTGTNLGPTSGGIAMVGRGSLNRFSAPAVATYTAAGTDDGNILSPANATGGSLPANWPVGNKSLTVTLPSAASVGAGWTMGFVSAGSNALVLEGSVMGPSGQTLSSLIVGAGGAGEFAEVYSDGTSLRLRSASQETGLYNGFGFAYPTQFSFPSSTGYAATVGDNGHWLSSSLAGGTLAITLPSTTALAPGWTIGGWVDAGNDVVFHVNSVSGGAIKTSSGSSLASYDLTDFVGSRAALVFDGANFREVTNSAGAAVNAGSLSSGAVSNALGFVPVSPYSGSFSDPVVMTGTFPAFNWSGTGGSWQTALDIANSPLRSDFVIADKCLSTGPTCPSVVDQLYDSNNQDGSVAFTVVSGGAAFNVGDWVRFNSGCTLNPTAIVTAETGGVVTALAPYYIGGYGRCATDPTGTQSQLSTSGSGAGLTATFTMTSNMPSLGIGQSPIAEYTSLRPMDEVVIAPYSAEPLRGALMLYLTPGNTGDPLDVWNPALGSAQLSIDTAGDLTTRGYAFFNQTLDSPPSFSSGSGVVYGNSNQGLSLYGKGSIYDVSMISSNGSVALGVLTGTLNVETPTGAFIFGTATTPPSFSSGQGAIFGGTTTGLDLQGYGSTYDVSLRNKNSVIALAIPTGTLNVVVPSGSFTVGSGSDAASFDSSGDLTTTGYNLIKQTLTSLPSFGAGNGVLYASAGNGITLYGDGSGYDVALLGANGSVSLGLEHGDNNVAIPNGVLRVQGSAGVTCSGAPTSSFAAVGGAVTHC